jgi:hypothetical protein
MDPTTKGVSVSEMSTALTLTESIVGGLGAAASFGSGWGAATGAAAFLVNTFGIDPNLIAQGIAEKMKDDAFKRLGADVYTSLSHSKCEEQTCLFVCRKEVWVSVEKDSVKFGGFFFTKVEAEKNSAKVLFKRLNDTFKTK